MGEDVFLSQAHSCFGDSHLPGISRKHFCRRKQQIHRQPYAPGWDSSDRLHPSLVICCANSTSSAQNLDIYHRTNAIIHLMISAVRAATSLIVR